MLSDEIKHFLEQALDKVEASTELNNLIEGYTLCACSEGKSENTIQLTRRAVGYLKDSPYDIWAQVIPEGVLHHYCSLRVAWPVYQAVVLPPFLLVAEHFIGLVYLLEPLLSLLISSRLAIHISGHGEKRAADIPSVSNISVWIGDLLLALFLRLVVELVKNKRGTISRSKPMNTRFIRAGNGSQSVSQLRQPFKLAPGCLNPKEFIETCEHKPIRLSTHLSPISYDKEKLLRHCNERIRRLARHLS